MSETHPNDTLNVFLEFRRSNEMASVGRGHDIHPEQRQKNLRFGWQTIVWCPGTKVELGLELVASGFQQQCRTAGMQIDGSQKDNVAIGQLDGQVEGFLLHRSVLAFYHETS
ncbi:hypothetical protein B0H14DRAFT_2605079 [Mycena olivaceomarginata]|nr:hypothetical protein B0H14DRAFT_2605079 [Mycena olivaceomarginata]